MSSQFLTCIFKLHNPSAHKQAVMDHALYEYTLAYSQLLERAKENEACIAENGLYIGRGNKAPKHTGKSIARFLKRPKVALHSSAVDSLIQDVAGNLASYFELAKVEEATSFPVGRDPSPGADDKALEDFALMGLGDFQEAQAALLRQTRARFMPVYFGRPDGASQTSSGSARNRNFSLLRNRDTGYLLAALWLLPMGHSLCKPLGADQGNLVRLDTGEVFKSNSKSAILVSLELGKNGWQETKFLTPAQMGQASIKSAFLVKDEREGAYYLNVSFAFERPGQYRPQAYLGIDKGILFTAAYAVVGVEGKVLDLGHFDDDLRELQIKHGRERERRARNGKIVTKRHYKRKAYENILHCLANDLIAKAQGAQAQIVVEDLNIQVRGSRVTSRFRKLDRILEYKCALAGVPFRRVFAAYSSMICHKCGELMDRDNRVVVCKHCGYRGHSDDNAAVNIARRAMYRKADWEGKGGYRAFHRSFENIDSLQTK